VRDGEIDTGCRWLVALNSDRACLLCILARAARVSIADTSYSLRAAKTVHIAFKFVPKLVVNVFLIKLTLSTKVILH
jgi:hypothetical protein